MAASAVPDSVFRKMRKTDPEPKLVLFLDDFNNDGTRNAQPYYHILRTPESVLRIARQAQATPSASALGSGQAVSLSYTNNVATIGGRNKGGIVIG